MGVVPPVLMRTTLTLTAVTCLLLVAATAPATHQVNLKTEWYDYAGTNLLGEPVAECDAPGLFGVRFCETLTDEDRSMPDRVAIYMKDSTGMRTGFYWAFKDADGATITSGFGCGFVKTFVPHKDVGPGEETGLYPDAVELVVAPDILTSLTGIPSPSTVRTIPLSAADLVNDNKPVDNVTVPEQAPVFGNTSVPVPHLQNETDPIPLGPVPTVCGSPTILTGTATVTWRYNSPVTGS